MNGLISVLVVTRFIWVNNENGVFCRSRKSQTPVCARIKENRAEGLVFQSGGPKWIVNLDFFALIPGLSVAGKTGKVFCACLKNRKYKRTGDYHTEIIKARNLRNTKHYNGLAKIYLNVVRELDI